MQSDTPMGVLANAAALRRALPSGLCRLRQFPASFDLLSHSLQRARCGPNGCLGESRTLENLCRKTDWVETAFAEATCARQCAGQPWQCVLCFPMPPLCGRDTGLRSV